MHARIAGGLYFLSVGFAWLTNLFPPFEQRVAPYDTAVGFIGEGALMLWLLVMGVKVPQRTTFG